MANGEYWAPGGCGGGYVSCTRINPGIRSIKSSKKKVMFLCTSVCGQKSKFIQRSNCDHRKTRRCPETVSTSQVISCCQTPPIYIVLFRTWNDEERENPPPFLQGFSLVAVRDVLLMISLSAREEWRHCCLNIALTVL